MQLTRLKEITTLCTVVRPLTQRDQNVMKENHIKYRTIMYFAFNQCTSVNNAWATLYHIWRFVFKIDAIQSFKKNSVMKKINDLSNSNFKKSLIYNTYNRSKYIYTFCQKYRIIYTYK